MKTKTIITICLLCFSFGCFAQSGIVVTGISQVSGSGGESVSYTVGQLDYVVANGGNGTAYAGLQQPFEISELTNIKNVAESVKIKLYPNPAMDKVIIEQEASDKNLLNARLISSEGKLINAQVLNSTSNEIEISELNPGAYILEIIDQNENKVKTYSIIKK